MQHWTQILFLILAFGGPALGGFLNWLKKQNQARERQRQAQAAQLESLRTGRPIATQAPNQTGTPAAKPAASQTAQERAAELIRRRQAQIEELRRRQDAAKGSGPVASKSSGQVRTTTPTGPRPVPRPAPMPQQRVQRGPPMPRTVARTTAQSQPLPSSRKPIQPVPQPASRPAPVNPPRGTDVPKSSIHELEIDQHVVHPTTEAARPPVAVLGHRMTGADWRRFIVARELIDPPLALRKPGDGPLSQI